MNESIITLQNMKNLSVTGVNKIKNLQPTHIVLDTLLGTLQIFGQNLEIEDFVNKSKVVITGNILKISYEDAKQKTSFAKKIFR